MLKRVHQDTFHKMSVKHLDRYGGEFAGRHNVRELDTLDQMPLLACGLAPLPYRAPIAAQTEGSGVSGMHSPTSTKWTRGRSSAVGSGDRAGREDSVPKRGGDYESCVGGMVDRKDQSPLAAARREMQEETGYDSADIVSLGSIHPNPAIQGNRCHSFLARNVTRKFEPSFDTTEETEVRLVPASELPELVRSGRITHALVVVAFYWHDLLGSPGPSHP